MGANLLVGLILDGRGVDGDAGAEALVGLRQLRVPENRDIRFRAGSKMLQGQRVEQTEGGLGDEATAVITEAGIRPSRPVRVTGEDLVVGLGAQEAHDAQLHDNLVDELLGALLVELAGLQVALDVDVEERGVAAEAHGSAILALDGGEIAHVRPLDGFLRGLRRAGQVEAVLVAEVDELLQCLDLVVMLFAEANPVLDLRLGEIVAVRHGILVALLELDQRVHTVQGHTAVVADDAAAAVGIRQTGEDLVMAGDFDVLGVHTEHAVIVGLAILGENLLDFRIGILAGFQNGLLDHAPAAVRHHRALAGFIGLQTDHDIVDFRALDVAGRERVDIGRGVGIHVIHTLAALDGEIVVVEILPHVLGLVSSIGQEGLIAFVRRVVLLNEVANIDILLPMPAVEAVPCLGFKFLLGERGLVNCCHIHSLVSVAQRTVTLRLPIIVVPPDRRQVGIRRDLYHNRLHRCAAPASADAERHSTSAEAGASAIYPIDSTDGPARSTWRCVP